MPLLDTVQSITKDELSKQPSPVLGIVTAYYDGSCTVRTDEGTFENIKCIGIAKLNLPCILIPVGETYVCIPNMDSQTTTPIVTSWETILSDEKVASEKLTKNTIDTYIGNINDYIGE
jgi:hypothetical protein